MDIVDTATVAAIGEIQSIATRHNLAVSIVTVDDVLGFLGVGVLARTDDVRDRVRASWEWRHYGEGWADWFGDLDPVARDPLPTARDDWAEWLGDLGPIASDPAPADHEVGNDKRADDQASWEPGQ